jgi:hypothetical protein
MIQIGNISEINEVKAHLNEKKRQGLIEDWELPYEHLLTRLDAAVFFITPSRDSDIEKLWSVMKERGLVSHKANDKKGMSLLEWRIEFN